MKGRRVVGSLTGVMKGRNMSMDLKRDLRNSILLPTLTYGLEKWTWSRAQQWRVCAVEMSYLRGACGVNRWDGVSNDSVHKMRYARVWRKNRRKINEKKKRGRGQKMRKTAPERRDEGESEQSRPGE